MTELLDEGYTDVDRLFRFRCEIRIYEKQLFSFVPFNYLPAMTNNVGHPCLRQSDDAT